MGRCAGLTCTLWGSYPVGSGASLLSPTVAGGCGPQQGSLPERKEVPTHSSEMQHSNLV